MICLIDLDRSLQVVSSGSLVYVKIEDYFQGLCPEINYGKPGELCEDRLLVGLHNTVFNN